MYNPLRKWVQRRPLVMVAATYGMGLWIGQNIAIPVTITAVAALILLITYLCIRTRNRRRRFSLFCAFVLCAAMGYSTYCNIRPTVDPRTHVRLNGIIQGAPHRDREKNRTVLALTHVHIDEEAQPYDVRVYVNGETAAPERFRPGQYIVITDASLWLPKGQAHPQGFDFARYLWQDHITACVTVEDADVLIHATQSNLQTWLFDLRTSWGHILDACFPNHAEMARALLIGDKSGLEDDLYEDFRAMGLAHLLALSGLHVTCIAFLLDALFGCLPLSRRFRYLLTCSMLGIYAFVVGASPSILRAVLMYSALRGGQWKGYPTDPLTRLMAAFLLLLLIRPLDIADTGFVLSFGAVAGMLLVVPVLQERIHLSPETRSHERRSWKATVHSLLRSGMRILVTTFGVQLATLPLVAHFFHQWPVWGLVMNLVAIPLTLLAIYPSAIALLVGACSLKWGAYIAWVPDQLFRLLAGWIEWGATFPLATLPIRAWPLWGEVGYGILLFLLSPYSPLSRKAAARMLGVIPLWIVVCAMWPMGGTGELTITFLDTGYSDSAVIYAEDRVYMVDCGRANGYAADYVSDMALSLDAIFLSHTDIDHAGGLAAVLEVSLPETIYLPVSWPYMDCSDTVQFALDAAMDAGVEIVYLQKGDRMRLSESVELYTLSPMEAVAPPDDNAGSLVFSVRYGEASAMFTGDLTRTAETGVAEDIDLLKVAHHGSKSSTSMPFLEACTPEVAVICVGKNGYHHPSDEVVARLEAVSSTVYRTDECGTITVRMQADGSLRVDTMRGKGE